MAPGSRLLPHEFLHPADYLEEQRAAPVVVALGVVMWETRRVFQGLREQPAMSTPTFATLWIVSPIEQSSFHAEDAPTTFESIASRSGRGNGCAAPPVTPSVHPSSNARMVLARQTAM